MRRVDSPTERTTAATDTILALLAFAAAIYLPLIGQQLWKAAIWASAFGLLVGVAALGAIAHGIKLSDPTLKWLWRLIYLALGQTVALFTVGTIYDVWGPIAALQMLPALLLIGIVFFTFTLIRSDTFFIFIIYQAVAMLFALGGYIWLAWSSRLEGAWLMVAGILVTMIAAGVQAGRSVSFTLIWQFDHNGAYHLVQIVGIALLAAGLRMGLLSS